MAVLHGNILKIILFWFLTIILSTTSTDDGNPTMREMTFKAYKNISTDEMLCSAEIPMQIFNEVKSRIQCTQLCLENPRCNGVNWKEPSTCELFSSPEITFKTVAGCTYLGGICSSGTDQNTRFPCGCSRSTGSSTLILRNDFPGSTSRFFKLPWTQYQQGFGCPTSLYWIGLDRLHQLTQGHCRVRFDLQAINGTWHYANYSSFSVGSSSTNYTLTIGGYSGDTGYDAMAGSSSWPFSTKDADHDGQSGYNCATNIGGGFWYGGSCADAYITQSITNINFKWYTSTGWMFLNAVEVSLLC